MRKFSRLLCLTSFFITIVCCNFVQAFDCCNLNYDFQASYLYWGVQEDQLGFAIEGLRLLQTTAPQANGKLKTHEPKWHSGVRLEGGIYSNCCPIGCCFAWTHFQAKSHAKARNIEPTLPTIGLTTVSVFPTNTGMGNPFLFSEDAKSRWRINLNEYTFDVAYFDCLGSCFSFRPTAGVMGATINQKQKIVYTGVLFDETLINLTVNRKNDFRGVGPRLGVGFNWCFCNRLSLFANAHTAFLVGRFHTRNKITVPTAFISSFPNLHSKFFRGRPMTSGQIGLEWEESICNCLALSLSVSYEFQYWWQQWHSSSNLLGNLATGEGKWGDLSLHGLVVSAGIAF